MKCNLVQFSIVVVGKVHNPSILNPDFLAVRQIVPNDWGWQLAEGNFTIPPLAVVQYKQGVSITVEPDKLHVVDSAPADPARSKVPEIVGRYVKTLPHVRYAGVGHNFRAIVEIGQPVDFLRERFLKAGSWDSQSRPLVALGLSFVYPLAGGRIVLSVDVGEGRKNESEEEANEMVIIGANFHRDCAAHPSDEEVLSHLANVAEDWSCFKKLVQDALDVEC